MKRIALIGSGITALSTAWQLKQLGNKCLVLEASGVIGGSIQSHRDGAYLAEEGPNSIQINTPEIYDFLCGIPGLKDRMIEAETAAKKRFIVRSGRLYAVPANPIEAITTKLWSLSGRLRVLREPFIQAIQPDVEESAASFVRRRLGEELYQYAINPLIGGIYAGDPEQLSLRYAFPKLFALEQAHGGLIRGGLAKMREARRSTNPSFRKRIVSFQDGLGELPFHLANALGPDSLKTSAKIDRIENIDQQWHLRINGETSRFDELIITLPAHQLSKLALGSEIAERIKSFAAIDYPPVSVLSLAYRREQVAHPLDGFGALVPECENRSILGVLFPSSVFQGRAPKDEVLLTAFVGGERQPELATADTARLQPIVESELRDLLGIEGTPTFAHHRHWARAIPQYKIGYGDRLEQIAALENDFKGLKLAGNYRTGISLSYCIENALGLS